MVGATSAYKEGMGTGYVKKGNLHIHEDDDGHEPGTYSS